MARRARRADPGALAGALGRWESGAAGPDDLRLLVKDTLARLSQAAPGSTVEVRVAPYGAVQVGGGPTGSGGPDGPVHRRGTPPAVVETDPRTWLELATGGLTWTDAVAHGRVKASGNRADLAALLPLLRL